jgi:hypothetical protein
MEHFIHSLKVFWRSEKLLKQNEIRLIARKIQCNALAGLVALFGLVMLSLSVFFALVPHIGNALAALTIGGTDLVIAGLLVAYANTFKPAPEAAMVRDMRDMAVSEMERELAKAEAEFNELRNEARRFVRNPIDALLPAVISPLLGSVAKGMLSQKKKSNKTAAH